MAYANRCPPYHSWLASGVGYPLRMAKKKKAAPKKKKALKKKTAIKKRVPQKKQKPKQKPKQKKTTIKKAIKKAKATARPRKPIKRRDATGHLDPNYARDLRKKSRENMEHDDDRGFLVGKNANEPLAQELGREFVETVTSGEDEGIELRDQFVTEEAGGPFVTTTRGQEIDEKPDASNPKGSTREPFPKT